MDHLNYPVVLKDVLSKKDFYYLWGEIEENWSYINQSKFDDPVFWGKRYNSDLTTLYCSSIIKLKLQKILKKKISLIRLQHNAQTCFQETNFHDDCEDEYGVWTFVLFTSPYWNTAWGGEFVILNKNTEDFDYVRYYPNNGVLFPSNWEHKGNSPNVACSGFRTSVAFQFCDSLIYDKLIEMHPPYGIYR